MSSLKAENLSSKVDGVRGIFEDLQYGPAPEAENVAQAWLDDHQRKFGHFIDGKWSIPDGRKTYQTKCPSTGEVLASTIQGEQADVDKAVESSRKAFESWGQSSGHYRARILYSIARHVQKHHRLFSVIESLDNGKPIRESRDADVQIVVRHLYHHAGWAQLMDTEMADWKPIGVVGAIVPWNFPLMLLMWKVCPALAMGNTVILKPATYTRLSALLFAEVCIEAGLPAGVFNVITGPGAMGSMLAGHTHVDKVAFTGSTEVGQTLRRLTAGSGKKLSLELGGKSPVIIFDSSDLDSSVEGVVDAIWFNQGQVCSAGSRLLIQESIYDEVISKIKERMKRLRLGDSLDKTIDMGPLVDETQRKSVEELVQSARNEGAEVYQNCTGLPKKGLFYPPTLITGVQTVSNVVVEEIFGPVAVAMPFRTAKEAVSLGNNTRYGLAASVWTDNVSLALEVALSLKAGSVWINSHNLFDAAAGFGGYRQSGFGRDGGKEGLFEYVRPSWEQRCRPKVEKLDLKTFGSSTPNRPTCCDNEITELQVDGISVPAIDRTYKMYYGGSQQRPDAPYARPIRNHSGKVIAHVGEGNRKDVRNAVEAAHSAAPGWGKRGAHNRAQTIYYMAENLEQRRNEFAQCLVTLTGCSEAEGLQEVDLSIKRLFHYGAYADKYGGSVQETTLYGATIKVHEPVGVIAIICPDTSPLLSFVSLLAPAVVRANCVVVVPSQKYPLLALNLYQVLDTSALPGGVINIITGDSAHLTKYLTEHQDIQSVWYHAGDSTSAQFVEYVSANNVKRTWVDYGAQPSRDWTDDKQAASEEFLYHSIQVKNIWIPMGDIFAN